MASTPGARQAPSPLLKRVLDRVRSEHGQPVPASPEALSLQLALRRLWADHVIWTREYVVAAIANSPDAQAVAGCSPTKSTSAARSSPSTANKPARR